MSALEQAWEAFGGAPLGPHHGWQKTLCVLHSERRPSAQVNLETGKWKCWAGCGFGDVYDLIGIHENLRDFLDQKRFAEDHGWYVEDQEPEPTVMNPRPTTRTTKKKGKPWKPPWT